MISRKERTAVPEELARLRQIASEPIMGGIKHDHSDTVAKLLDIREEYERKWDELLGVRDEVITKIESLPKQAHRSILSSRYIYNLSWREILSNHVKYSWGHVKRLHREALEEYCKLAKDEP